MKLHILTLFTLTRTLLHPRQITRIPGVSMDPIGAATQSRDITGTGSSSALPNFSSNYNPEQGTRDLAPLLKESGGKWELIETGKGLERGFKFKTFKKTWEFMNIIAAECAVKKHHPEWSNVYNTTFIRWTTHSPSGLSEKDVIMAKYCDEQSEKCGEVENAETSAVGKELADRVATEGGDCCVPKRKEPPPAL